MRRLLLIAIAVVLLAGVGGLALLATMDIPAPLQVYEVAIPNENLAQ